MAVERNNLLPVDVAVSMIRRYLTTKPPYHGG
jgi:hypothetical protein